MDADEEQVHEAESGLTEEAEDVEALLEKEEIVVAKYDEPSHAQQILTLLEKDTQYCDVTIEAEGETVKVHKNLFGVYSDFFNKAFNTEMQEKYENVVKLQGVRSDVMKSIVGFLYSGKIDISSENAIDLLAAADYLMIDKIKRFSSNFLSKDIMANDCFHLWEYGKKYDEEKLVENSLVFIGTHLKETLETVEADKLNTEEFGEILATSKSFRKSEEETYQVVLSWIKENLDARQEKLLPLIQNLDLCQLSREYFIETVLQEQLVRRSAESMAIVADELARRNNQLNAEKENMAEEHRDTKRKLTDKSNELNFLWAADENQSTYKFDICEGSWKQQQHSYPSVMIGPDENLQYAGIAQGEHLFKIESSTGRRFIEGIVCSSTKKDQCDMVLTRVNGTIYAVEKVVIIYSPQGYYFKREKYNPLVFRYDERLDHWTKVSVEDHIICQQPIHTVFTAK